MSRDEDIEKLKKYRFFHQLTALPCVEAIYLYGSRARGDYGERSDIDLAIRYAGKEAYEWLKVQDVIDEADTLLEISAIDLAKAEGQFRANILKDAVTLYERKADNEF